MPELLLVHADPAAITTIGQALAAAGYRVSAASTYAEGRRALEGMVVDMLVADVRLGEYNGIHLAAYAHAHRRVPTVVTHYTHDVSLAKDAMLFGAVFIVDPIGHLPQLLETVREMCPPAVLPSPLMNRCLRIPLRSRL